jgi:hypothetical protein
MSLIIESFGGNGTIAIVKGNDLFGLKVGERLYTEAEMSPAAKLGNKQERSDGNDTIEHTGRSVSYYDVTISQWTNPDHQEDHPVTVSCNDIIEALDMGYAEANVFKAQWRIAAAKQGKMKKGNNTVYDAEKSCFFSERVLVKETLKSQR